MNGFLRSKLVLSLAALIMIAAAIAIPLSGSITRAHAQGTVTISEFSIPTSNSNPVDITSGPDGNLWFVEFNGDKIGKITPTGTVTEYAIPTSNTSPEGITSGPDGNLWFTEQYGASQIGKITPGGTITEYPTPSNGSAPTDITSGPDGNLWFTENFGNKIAKSTPNGTITEYTIPTSNSGPVGITSGPDGNLWFTEGNVNQIGKITTSGTITEYVIPTGNSTPARITSGPDGNLWFAESKGNKIGKITPSGTITEYPIPTSGGNPIGITSGPDGNLWFAELYGSKIGEITTSGTITEYSLPSGFGYPVGITSGPDGNIWFTEAIGNAIGRVNLTPPLKQLSSDSYPNSTSQHKTEVEPDSFSFGSTIVSAFQVSRFPAPAGGSDNIGWATSTNSGGSWSHGFLSGITKIAGGSYSRVSDPVVTYDARHKIWMIVSIAFDTASPGTNAILVSRSTNGGLTWGNPVPVHVQGPPSILDKPWIVCDNTTSSPHYGNCYVEWDDAKHGDLIFMSTSTNGGTIWGSPKMTAGPDYGVGGQPLVKPNGNVIVPIDNASATGVQVFTSTDGGKSWGAATSLSDIQFHQPAGGLRADPLISASIDGAGTIYIVWADCRYVTNCAANQIVLLTYSGSTTLSVVKPISIDQPNSSLPDFMIPNIAVDKATSGSTVHLKLTYYYYPVANCDVTTCDLDVGFFTCIGTTCSSQLQLAGPMKLTWLPKTDHGVLNFCLPDCRMVGDYISTSIVNGKSFPVFAKANALSVGTDCSAAGAVCQEAIFTVAGGLS